MLTSEEFEHECHTLHEACSIVQGAMVTNFPPGFNPAAGVEEGLAEVGSRIEDLMAAFNRLQNALARSSTRWPERHESRFGKFFEGRDGAGGDES